MSRRLDVVVAERFGLSRAKAAAVIMAGQVSVGGKPARKAGQPVTDDADVEYRGDRPPVSRAAGKLAAVLDRWPIVVDGTVVLDVGSSTGGFTQTVLERGAKKVFAVDVGRGQLAWELRNDPRVVSMEQTDIRTVTELPETPDLAVADVSFISLRQVLPAVAQLLPADAPVIALFKPQFEVGKDVASKHGGVIRDQAIVEEVFTAFTGWTTEHGWHVRESAESTVPGAKGNRERLVWLTTPR